MKRQTPIPVPKLNPHEQEIIEYLRKKPLEECTLSRMSKPGGLRETATNPNYVKKYLERLVEKGYIIARHIKIPISGRKYTYYILIRGGEECGSVGIPKLLKENKDAIKNFIWAYYSSLRYWNPIEIDYCRLCRKWTSFLKKQGITFKLEDKNDEMGCGNFLQIFQGLEKEEQHKIEIYTESGDLDITRYRKELKDIENEFMKNVKTSGFSILLLEDLTLALVASILHYGYLYPRCKKCKNKKECLDEGYKWVKDFIGDILHIAPKEPKIVKFWIKIKNMEKEFDTKLIFNHFEEKYGSESLCGKNLLSFPWKIYRGYPYFFYSKLIPLAVSFLVDSTIDQIENMNRITYEFKKKYWQ